MICEAISQSAENTILAWPKKAQLQDFLYAVQFSTGLSPEALTWDVFYYPPRPTFASLFFKFSLYILYSYSQRRLLSQTLLIHFLCQIVLALFFPFLLFEETNISTFQRISGSLRRITMTAAQPQSRNGRNLFSLFFMTLLAGMIKHKKNITPLPPQLCSFFRWRKL